MFNITYYKSACIITLYPNIHESMSLHKSLKYFSNYHHIVVMENITINRVEKCHLI